MKGAVSSSQARALTILSVSALVAVAAWTLFDRKRRTAVIEDESARLISTNSSSPDERIHSQAPLAHVEFDAEITSETQKSIQTPNTITICYASVTGTCATFAKDLSSSLEQSSVSNMYNVTIQTFTVDQIDWWEELLTSPCEESNNNSGEPYAPPILLFVLPTWTQGTLPEPYSILLSSIQDIIADWRVAPQPLRHKDSHPPNNSWKKIKHPDTLRVACFGIGSSAYDPNTFCKPSKDVFSYFMKLGAHSLLMSKTQPIVGMGDVEVGNSAQTSFATWKDSVIQSILRLYQSSSITPQKTSCCRPDSTSCSCVVAENISHNNDEKKDVDHVHSDTAEEKYNDYDDLLEPNVIQEQDMDIIYEDDESCDEGDESEAEILDLEDIGDIVQASTKMEGKDSEPKEMLTMKQAAALKKEGYRIIGSHSAVKLCRWTKHQLRGRGGCYKHTFYGITSYQCMEATPSLACANKCVFCWRHHKNPVGKEWRWKTDDPYYIVEQAIHLHVGMIKEAKGIPGVVADRWREAHTVKHCALSLVGEPIMYPRINELLGELHRRSISTFLVTNGQHPHAIETVCPVTQLYVSVDASTPETLEAIDRPLFSDAWDRLCSSLTSLKNRGQRTVARLTVVKGWNSDEIEGYAKLIALGHCSFVEVKGVTFCGKSDASNLNMSNTPYHFEVIAFSRKLVEILSQRHKIDETIPEYDLACEHKHSCSVLIARVDLFAKIDSKGERTWHTWIDYEKFNQLVMKHESDKTFTFTANDYSAETPAWALFGADEEGFDPTDSRHRRKSKLPKYTKFDQAGVPTHDELGVELSLSERQRLRKIMDKRIAEIGDGQSITEAKDGSKKIEDASLMFRGMVTRLD